MVWLGWRQEECGKHQKTRRTDLGEQEAFPGGLGHWYRAGLDPGLGLSLWRGERKKKKKRKEEREGPCQMIFTSRQQSVTDRRMHLVAL